MIAFSASERSEGLDGLIADSFSILDGLVSTREIIEIYTDISCARLPYNFFLGRPSQN